MTDAGERPPGRIRSAAGNLGGGVGLLLGRPIAVLLLSVGLLLAGGLSFATLPIAPLPRVDLPTIMVSAKLPGADPETMAATVTAPLERRLGEIAGVSELTSTSGQGTATIVLQFDPSRTADSAARDVQAALNASGGDLPADLPNPPTYRKANPADQPILVLAVTSKTLRMGALYDAADVVLAQGLSQIPGVAQVSVGGAVKPAVRVRLDPQKLASMGLGGEDIRALLAAQSLERPLGALEGAEVSTTVSSNDALGLDDDWSKIVVRAKNGWTARLGDVAQVERGQENDRQAGWKDRDRAVLVIVQKQADANAVETADRVKAALPQLRAWMPAGAETTLLADRTGTIRAGVRDVEATLLLTVGLVTLVVLLSLGRWVPTLAACAVVPLSLAGTFAAMRFLGYSLDNVSLMALTISVGFVVDDAVVMIENVAARIENGEDPLRAAAGAARQMAFTVASISVSLVAVFVPLLFMNGSVGLMLREFAVTLTVAILVSMAVSVAVAPVLHGHLASRVQDRPVRWIAFGDRILTSARRRYLRGLGWTMRRGGLMLGLTAATMAATAALYVQVPKGLFPAQDTGMIVGSTETRVDASFSVVVDRQGEVIETLLADDAVESVASFVGSGGPGGGGSNTARMFITLKPLSEGRPSAAAVVDRLRPKLGRVLGVNAFLTPAQDLAVGGRASRSQYQFVLWSESLSDLREWAPKLMDRLKETEGLVDVTSDQDKAAPQETIVVDRVAASRLGIDPTAIDNALQNAFSQRQISTIYTQRNQYHVVLDAGRRFGEGAGGLASIHVPSKTGRQIPLSAVASLKTVTTPPSVNHQGQFPAATISFNLKAGAALSGAAESVAKAQADIRMPSNLHAEFAGTAKAFADTTRGQPMLLAAALVVIYIVLGVLYESTIHPLTILSTLPSAGLGALLALLATGTELSVISFIGVLLLMGIVKKNGILLVDFAVEAERRGKSPRRAVLEACRRRFRPIVMTTVAAVFGALPLALGMGAGAELRRPLGIAVVGGLVLSQILTLYTTPAVYLALDRLHRRFRAVEIEDGEQDA